MPKTLDERCSLTEYTPRTGEMSNFAKSDYLAHTENKNEMKKNLFEEGKYANCLRPFFGLLLSAFGAFVMAVASVMVKKLTSTSVFAILTIRFVVMLAIAVPILYFR